MACSLPCGPSLPRLGTEKAVRRRLGAALCASVFGHACLLATEPGGVAVRPSALPARASLSARIAVTPAENAQGAAQGVPAAPRVPPAPEDTATDLRAGERMPRAERLLAGSRSNPAPSAEKSAPTAKPAPLAAAVDTTWYTAWDIDTYPRANAALSLVPPAGSGETAVRMLLWLRIDEHGQVAEVSAGEPGIPAPWVDAARASLAAVRFTPARKDERAVRSRLLLSLRFAPAEAGRNADLATGEHR
jgi:hypothetical protein